MARLTLALLGAFAVSCTTPPTTECWDSVDNPRPEKGSTVTITGRVERADGAVATGQVLLEKPPSASELAAAAFTAGLSCLQPSATIDCSDYTRLALSEGAFSTTVPEADTRGTFGDRPFFLYAGAQGAGSLAGASVAVQAYFRQQPVALPLLRLWEPTFTTSASGMELTVAGSEPAALGCMTRSSHELQFRSARGLLWSQAGGPVDLRVLEDDAVALSGLAHFKSEFTRAVSSVWFRSGEVTVQGTAGRPPSRGASCALGTQPQSSSCALTDGALTTTVVNDGAATIDLGAVRTLALIVVRGALTSATLEGSTDGASWTPLASGLSGAFVAAPSTASARFVRLSEGRDEQNQQRMLSVSEVSVW